MKQIYLKFSMLLLCMVVGLSAWAQEVTAVLEGTSMLESEKPSTSYADHSDGITDSDGNVWTGRWTYQKASTAYYEMVQIKAPESSVTSRLNFPTFKGEIQSVTVVVTNANASSSAGSKPSGTLYVTKDWAKANYSKEENVVASADLSTVGAITFDLSSDSYTGEGLYLVSSASTRIWSVKVVYKKGAEVAVSGISLDESKISLCPGETAKLTATVLPANATNKAVTWASNNEEVATVSQGVVTAVEIGEATITATTADGNKVASCVVTVSKPASTGSVYKKVTSSLRNWSGKYLIVYEAENAAIALNAALSTIDVVGNSIPVTVSNNTINGDKIIDAAAVTVEKINGGYSIKIGNGNYIGIGGKNNGLSTNAKQDAFINLFKYNDEGYSEIYIENAETMYLNYNASSSQIRFRYYANASQKPIQLYKLEEEAPASYSLTISPAEYATFYDSKNAYVMPEDCEGYVFTVANGLELAYESGETVPAGEPLVIYTIEPGTKELVYTTSTEDSYKSGDMNDLEGTDEETALEADANSYFYALSVDKEGKNVGFYWMNATGAAFTNGAHKAYLQAAGTSENAKNFIFGETTAIKTIATATDTKIYDLTGREVKSPKAGIYVVNGVKKYIK